MSRQSEVTFETTVTVRVPDESVSDVLERPLSAEWSWRFYHLDGIEQVAEVLARTVGLDERPLSDLPGWDELDDEAVSVQVDDLRVIRVIEQWQ